MEKLMIICVDDQREVLNALTKDLALFEEFTDIEECDSGQEALDVMDEIDAEGAFTAVIISDHVMPDMTGVEFMAKVNKDGRFKHTKKILLTGLATHKDTIEAINKAGIDRYIEKPWSKENLIRNVKELLTEFLFDQGIDYEPFRKVIDQATLLERLKTRI